MFPRQPMANPVDLTHGSVVPTPDHGVGLRTSIAIMSNRQCLSSSQATAWILFAAHAALVRTSPSVHLVNVFLLSAEVEMVRTDTGRRVTGVQHVKAGEGSTGVGDHESVAVGAYTLLLDGQRAIATQARSGPQPAASAGQFLDSQPEAERGQSVGIRWRPATAHRQQCLGAGLRAESAPFALTWWGYLEGGQAVVADQWGYRWRRNVTGPTAIDAAALLDLRWLDVEVRPASSASARDTLGAHGDLLSRRATAPDVATVAGSFECPIIGEFGAITPGIGGAG